MAVGGGGGGEGVDLVVGGGAEGDHLGGLLAAVEEADDVELDAGVLGHAAGELEGLAVVGAAEEDDADAVGHLVGADLLAAAESAVHEHGHGARRLPQDPPVHRPPLGPQALLFSSSTSGALVEGEDDEGDALVLGDGGHVVVHRVERGHGRHGPDADMAQLRVGAERHVHLAPAAAIGGSTPGREEGRHAVAAGGAGHEDGGGALRELHEAEDVELHEPPRLRVAPDGLDEVDQGRDLVPAVDAGEHAELLGVGGGGTGGGGGGGGGSGGAVELAVVQAAARRLVDGHDRRRGDEGGHQRHYHQDRKHLLVQNLQSN